MINENPYDAPRDIVGPSARLTPLLWSVAVVFGCAGLGGVMGLAMGAALGTFAPGYYRSLFQDGGEPHFDPVAVGIGQGLTQGTVFGGIIGLLLVAMWYWYHSRSTRESLK